MRINFDKKIRELCDEIETHKAIIASYQRRMESIRQKASKMLDTSKEAKKYRDLGVHFDNMLDSIKKNEREITLIEQEMADIFKEYVKKIKKEDKL
jgi:prefoldin subunit 5